MEVALSFALNNLKPDFIPVLFVFLNINYKNLQGFMMNNEAFTAYPSEGELLFMEGHSVVVLAIEENLKIENLYESMQRFNGSTITIVYL